MFGKSGRYIRYEEKAGFLYERMFQVKVLGFAGHEWWRMKS